MSDLISRQAAIDTLDSDAELLRRVLDDTDIVGATREKYEWELGLIESYISDMKDLPSAQPERKKGKWIRENIVLTSNPPQYQWHCSECGRLVHWFSTEILTNFCPNCGADMRGENYAD